MHISLTSNFQDQILITLRNGGNLICFSEKVYCGWDEYRYQLTDNDGNDLPIRSDSVKKLVRLKFLKQIHDRPAMDITGYFITNFGLEWLKMNYG